MGRISEGTDRQRCFLAATASSAAAFDFDKTPGRLPKIVVPLDYTIAFMPNIAGENDDWDRTRHAPSTKIDEPSRVQYAQSDVSNVRVDGVPAQSVITQNGKQLSTVSPRASHCAYGHHVMTLSYTGRSKAALAAFLRSRTARRAGAARCSSSQLESTDARRFFPCWDEPAFRARFTLTATIPAAWSAVGNMPIAHRVVHGSLADVTFERTPKMSTYLVEFSAGILGHISARNDGYTHTVWAVRGEEKTGRDALQASQDILNDYNTYFGFRFPIPKLDSIAIPGGFPGAMENWGAITYTEKLSPDRAEHDDRHPAIRMGRASARDVASVDRRSRDDGLVEQHLAQRELRVVDGNQRNGASASRLGVVGSRR